MLTVVVPEGWGWEEGYGDFYVRTFEENDVWNVWWIWTPDEGWRFESWVFETEAEAREFAHVLKTKDGVWPLECAEYLDDHTARRRTGFRAVEDGEAA